MKKYFLFIIIFLLMVGLGWLGYKYREKIYKLKNLFNFECIDISELEEKNEKFKEDIKILNLERAILQPQIKRQQIYSDSLIKVDSLLKLDILKERQYTKSLERKLSISKDSVKKYKLAYVQSRKKYEELKNTQKKPTNQQTLDFFKKY